MNKQLYLIILLLYCRICNAQNLIPNGDFEQYSGCPNTIGQLDSALFWFNLTGASPDYYNQCSNPSVAGVPDNLFGSQPAHSGAGYCGVFIWTKNQVWREYIEVPLLSQLIANECYHLEMYINLGNNCKYTTDAIGAYFSDTLFTDFSTTTVLSFIPQTNNAAGNYPDKINWTLVSGNYIANGGESYIIIGNFKNNSNTDTIFVNSTNHSNIYFYIDDASLSPCTSIEEQNENTEIKIYPNPLIDKLNVTINNKVLSEIILYDTASRKIMQQKFTNSVSLNTEQLAKGLYLYEVRSKDGSCKKGKVVKD